MPFMSDELIEDSDEILEFEDLEEQELIFVSTIFESLLLKVNPVKLNHNLKF